MAPSIQITRIEASSTAEEAFLIVATNEKGQPLKNAQIDVVVTMMYLGTGGENKWPGLVADNGSVVITVPHRGPGADYVVTASVRAPVTGIEIAAAPLEGLVPGLTEMV